VIKAEPKQETDSGIAPRLAARANTRRGRLFVMPVLLAALLILSGCGILFGTQENDQPPAEDVADRQLVPTFTPTPEGAEPVVEAPPAEAPAAQEPLNTPTPLPIDEPEPEEISEIDEPEPEPTPEPPTPTSAPSLFVNIDAANLRNGPGTNYGLAGAATLNQEFEVVGRSPDGGWWQVCCVNGQQAWIFGDLVRTENVEGVPVAQNIPAPPVAQAPPAQPEPQPQPPAQPEPQPEPPAEPEPEPEAPPEQSPGQAVNAGECSQCKFNISAGPTKRPNSGLELKIQADFIHSGVDGGQRQGDYRIGLEKDGQLIVHFADTLSVRLSHNDGPMGPYNYEASVGASDLPGGTVAGRYFFWVIDGNRIRDSQVWTLDLGEGEGEVWIQFDQN
jgi:hypothetical protein